MGGLARKSPRLEARVGTSSKRRERQVASALDPLRGTAAAGFIALSTVFWSSAVYLLAALRPLCSEAGRVALGTAMFRMVDGWVVGVRAACNRLRVVRIDAEVAGPLRRDGCYLVICNHRSWADILVLTFAFYGCIPQFKFFTKRELIWVPFIGLALWLLDFPLLRRYSRAQLAAKPALRERDRAVVQRACNGFLERPTSVLNFVEGTRFSTAKRERQGAPYRHLLLPKSGGVAMTLAGLGDRLDGIVDATISYPGPAPSFWSFLCGRCPVVRLHAALLPPPLAGPTPDAEGVRRWLAARWQCKDARLATAGDAPLDAAPL